MQEIDVPQGIIKNEKGEPVILLPAGPIRSTVIGISGDTYSQTLHDDAQLGRPTAKLDPVQTGESK